MTTPFDQVKVVAECLVQECSKQGCTMDLADAPHPFRLIDMDHPCSLATGGRCDYLFIGAGGGRADVDLYVAPLELKSSAFRATGVAKQLTGGARAAHRAVPNVRCQFVPVVAHAGAHRNQINALAKQQVHFRGKDYAIRVVRCGERIVDVLPVL